MDNKYFINLQGKNFIKFEGLLAEFHKNKGKSIETAELENSTPDEPKFKAIVKGEKGEYTGHGDANNQNVNSLIAKHKYRMAETRAIARALRWYNNIGECSVDELGGESNGSNTKQPQASANIQTSVNKSNNYKKKDNDDSAWITDELFEDAIKKSVEAGVFKIGTESKKVMAVLRLRYKVAKKYEAMVNETINKYAIK